MMSESEKAWKTVGERFDNLGSMFREHYQAQGTDGSDVPSEGDVREAVRVLGESIESALGAFGDSVTDPEVQNEARRTAGAFFDALGTTFSELGAEITKDHEGDSS